MRLHQIRFQPESCRASGFGFLGLPCPSAQLSAHLSACTCVCTAELVNLECLNLDSSSFSTATFEPVGGKGGGVGRRGGDERGGEGRGGERRGEVKMGEVEKGREGIGVEKRGEVKVGEEEGGVEGWEWGGDGQHPCWMLRICFPVGSSYSLSFNSLTCSSALPLCSLPAPPSPPPARPPSPSLPSSSDRPPAVGPVGHRGRQRSHGAPQR